MIKNLPHYHPTNDADVKELFDRLCKNSGDADEASYPRIIFDYGESKVTLRYVSNNPATLTVKYINDTGETVYLDTRTGEFSEESSTNG